MVRNTSPPRPSPAQVLHRITTCTCLTDMNTNNTGYVGDTDMHEMVSAVVAAGASPIVRIRGPTGPLIKRALDSGAQ